jgi:hypothetical protein
VDIKKCGKDGCNPVEQIRGQMKPEDHHRQFARYVAADEFQQKHGVLVPVEPFRQDAHEVEDLGGEHARDVRISCSRCGKATGWDRADTEEFRRHADGDYRRHMVTMNGNVKAVHERWAKMVP